ncbi:MAG: hypothetical protein RQ714_04255 [Nitrosomonas sp.]|nr:hypothetical protein [Nitrosomonas sp.]
MKKDSKSAVYHLFAGRMPELESSDILSGILLGTSEKSGRGFCMRTSRYFLYLLAGILNAFPLACLSSGIYKVEDEKGHVTYTNTPSATGKRNSTRKMSHENTGLPGQQKHDGKFHPTSDQVFTMRSRQLGDGLRAPGKFAMPQSNTTRENIARDQLNIDDYNIQVFDIKIKSF